MYVDSVLSRLTLGTCFTKTCDLTGDLLSRGFTRTCTQATWTGLGLDLTRRDLPGTCSRFENRLVHTLARLESECAGKTTPSLNWTNQACTVHLYIMDFPQQLKINKVFGTYHLNLCILWCNIAPCTFFVSINTHWHQWPLWVHNLQSYELMTAILSITTVPNWSHSSDWRKHQTSPGMYWNSVRDKTVVLCHRYVWHDNCSRAKKTCAHTRACACVCGDAHIGVHGHTQTHTSPAHLAHLP